MANRLSDLNRSKREYAFSGRADTGDIPWLYEVYAQQAAANQPAGIGEGGGMGDDAAAPNPTDFGSIGGGGTGGGGASGAADAGLSGPGLDGYDNELYNLIQQYERGGQAGEPGGAGAGSVEYGPDGYIDLTGALGYGLDALSYLGPGPLGLVGSLAKTGVRGYNAGLLDDELTNAGYDTGLSGWQQIGAALGLNDYGLGDPRDVYGAQGIGGLAEAAYDAGIMGGINDPALGVSANQRARSDTRGGAETGGSAYGADPALGRSSQARHAERTGGGGAEGGGRGGGSDQGGSANDRGNSMDGRYHDGGYISEDNNPNQRRGDVKATLQEGEGVLTADAVEILTPGFVHGVNMMAKMLRSRR